jgi:flavin reductase (DIM6/NTAB) family NADH-FMN oxidoreductase RutF
LPIHHFDQLAFKATVGRFPTGLTIVTGVSTGGEPQGMTLQSFMSLSLNPTLIALAVAKTSSTWPKIAPSGSFAVNVLAHRHGELARRFASKPADRFTDASFSTARSGNPVLDGAAAWLDCSTVTTFEIGDHVLVVGEVVELMESAHGETDHPIVYYRSRFHSLAQHA